MDCGNYSINWILNTTGKKINYDEESIFSEYYPEVSLLPKIGKILLKQFPNVIIIHENNELFTDLKTDEEQEIANEYREELYNYMSKGGKFGCDTISLELINEFTSNNFYCIAPINKENGGSHFVVLRKENDNRKIIDNKKGEYNVTDDELLKLINIKNGKYVLFCGDYINKLEE